VLAIAYGRDNQFGMAALGLAEEGSAAGKKKDAVQQALRAKALLPKNSPRLPLGGKHPPRSRVFSMGPQGAS
jgi:hypothetical protein